MKSLCIKLKTFITRCSLSLICMSMMFLSSFKGEAKANLLAVAEMAFQDTEIVSGVVTDENGNGLPGVSILIKVTATGTITELDGSYRLNVDSNSAVLIFTFVGYKNQEIYLLGRSILDVSMEPDIESLEGVVVTAMGIEREDKIIGYAVSTLKGEDLAQATLDNPVSSFQGKTAGVQISTTSGANLEDRE